MQENRREGRADAAAPSRLRRVRGDELERGRQDGVAAVHRGEERADKDDRGVDREAELRMEHREVGRGWNYPGIEK